MDGVGLDDTLNRRQPLTPGDLVQLSDARRQSTKMERQRRARESARPWSIPAVRHLTRTRAMSFTAARLQRGRCAGLATYTPDDKLSYWVTQAANDLVNLVGEDTGRHPRVEVDVHPRSAPVPGLTAMCTQSPGLVAATEVTATRDGLSYIHGWCSWDSTAADS